MLVSSPLNRLNDLYGNIPMVRVEYQYSITNIMGKTKKITGVCNTCVCTM